MKFPTKAKLWINGIAFFLFTLGIILGTIGSQLSVRNTQNYQSVQPELYTPCEIETVLQDENLEQIYVCYNDASYVNVYSYSGDFLWAVSTPYIRNAYFELIDHYLVIYDSSVVYVYDSKTGTYIDSNIENLELSFDWEIQYTENFEIGEFYFDTYQVYRAGADGNLKTIVERPFWFWLFHFGVCWCISFVGAVCLGASLFFTAKAEWRKNKKQIDIQNKRVRFILKYYQILSTVHLIYTVANIFLSVYTPVLIIGIIPLALHFIIICIIFENKLEHLPISKDETPEAVYRRLCAIGSFIIAFLSVIVASIIAG